MQVSVETYCNTFLNVLTEIYKATLQNYSANTTLPKMFRNILNTWARVRFFTDLFNLWKVLLCCMWCKSVKVYESLCAFFRSSLHFISSPPDRCSHVSQASPTFPCSDVTYSWTLEHWSNTNTDAGLFLGSLCVYLIYPVRELIKTCHHFHPNHSAAASYSYCRTRLHSSVLKR